MKIKAEIHVIQKSNRKNYTKTDLPVVTWFSTRLLLIISVINQWHTQQVDFMQPHSLIEHELYINLPKWIETKTGNGKTHSLKLIRNLYRNKLSVWLWKKYLTNKLITVAFKQSAIKKRVLFQGHTIFAFYVNDFIFYGPCKGKIDKSIHDTKKTVLYIEYKREIENYLRINVYFLPDGRIKIY